MVKEMFDELYGQLRKRSPLIHCITNYVAANDCANILLACGASPIMSDSEEEAGEVASGCCGLSVNIGTLNRNRLNAMLIAGKAANEKGIPVIFDPVGAGFAPSRTASALKIAENIRLTAIRGNISEIRAAASGMSAARGVDADPSYSVTEDNINETAENLKKLSEKTGAIIAATGKIDIVASPEKAFCIRNGSPMLRLVTGAGCQLTAMMTAYIAANPDKPLEAAAAAVCAMGICGEIAEERMNGIDGSGSFRVYLMDAVSRLTPEIFEERGQYDII